MEHKTTNTEEHKTSSMNKRYVYNTNAQMQTLYSIQQNKQVFVY